MGSRRAAGRGRGGGWGVIPSPPSFPREGHGPEEEEEPRLALVFGINSTRAQLPDGKRMVGNGQVASPELCQQVLLAGEELIHQRVLLPRGPAGRARLGLSPGLPFLPPKESERGMTTSARIKELCKDRPFPGVCCPVPSQINWPLSLF